MIKDNPAEKLNIAIVYYCYNRLDHTKRSLSKILEYREDLHLYIFSDAGKDMNNQDVIDIRKYINDATSGLDNITIILRNKNYGLSYNVINGISQVFKNNFDAVIVLEDDCVPEIDFFNFMLSSLNFYANNEGVMHISGFGLPLKHKFNKDYYFTPYPCSWGWGTWKSDWCACDFEDNIFYNKILDNYSITKQFDWSGKSFSYFLGLHLNNKIDSWLIRWYAHVFKNKGLCLWVVDSKLENIGFDGTGAHKVKFDRFNQKKIAERKEIIFKNNLTLDLKIICNFKQFFMGPALLDKIKTMIYMYTGLLLDKIDDNSEYYKKC